MSNTEGSLPHCPSHGSMSGNFERNNQFPAYFCLMNFSYLAKEINDSNEQIIYIKYYKIIIVHSKKKNKILLISVMFT
jgi:hypothetical protein